MNKTQYDCIIADDDILARTTLEFYVRKSGLFNIVGSFESASKALLFIQNNNIPQVLFLDIDMPGISGLELRKKLNEVPVCVFISSHPDYAIESFELETLDFIQKPLLWERFEKTIERIEEYFDIHQKAELFEENIGGDFFYIKVENEQVKIKLQDILYLEARRNYTAIVTKKDEYSVLKSFSSVLQEEFFQSFVQVHRSFAIHPSLIKKISKNKILLDNDVKIPIGRSFKNNLNLINL